MCVCVYVRVCVCVWPGSLIWDPECDQVIKKKENILTQRRRWGMNFKKQKNFIIIIIIHSFYIALFSALKQTHCAHWHMILNECLKLFIVRIINIHGSGVLTAFFWVLHGWCYMKYCHFSAGSVYTIQPCTRLQCHFIQSHIGRVCVCLGVTCHLHFWQNDRDLLVLLQ